MINSYSKNHLFLFATIFLVTVTLVTFNTILYAAEEQKPYSIELLTEVKSTKKTIENNYLRYQFIKGYPSNYQFSVLLPKEWEIKKQTFNKTSNNEKNSITPLASLLSNTDPVANIDIFAAVLKNEINPNDWLLQWLESEGYAIQHSRVLPTRYGQVGDYIAQKEINGTPYTYRFYAIKDKNRIYLLSGKAPAQHYKKYEETFLLAIQSFKLIQPTKELYAEPFTELHLTKPYTVTVRHPTSWQKVIEQDKSNNELSFSLINKRKNITLGHINTVLIPAHLNISPEDMLETWLKKLKLNHIQLSGKSKQTNNKNTNKWHSLAFRDAASLELYSTMIKHPQGILMVNLITPSPKESYETWAINQRTYQILLNTAKF